MAQNGGEEGEHGGEEMEVNGDFIRREKQLGKGRKAEYGK